MKRLVSILMGISLIFLLTACSSTSVSQNNSSNVNTSSTPKDEQSENSTTGDKKQKKNLVVYFSCTGNTEKIAKAIAKNIDADTYQIIPAEEYTSEDLDYNDSNSRVSKEHEDSNSRPEISNKIENLDKYENIFIGYPIWWGEVPRIMSTFMESYDFSNKTIIPFCTSASSDIGNSADALKKLCSDKAKWLDGERFSGNATNDEINQWIKSLKIN